jgi:hypothetical protein
MCTDMSGFLMVILQFIVVLVMGFSAWLVIRQIKIATQVSRFDVMLRIAELIQSIDNSLYNMPINIVYRSDEFPDTPPPRYDRWNPTSGEVDIMTKAKEKRASFFTNEGGYKEFDLACLRAINALNDIAQYIEDGYASYADVLGQYHFKIIRILHIVEAFRSRRSGDYGHRLLRLRQKAIEYHYMHPKHGDKDVILQLNNGGEIILLKRMHQTRESKQERKKYRKSFKRKCKQ